MTASEYIEKCRRQVKVWEAIAHRHSLEELALECRRRCDHAKADRLELAAGRVDYRGSEVDHLIPPLREGAGLLERVWQAEVDRQIAVAMFTSTRAARKRLELKISILDAGKCQAEIDLNSAGTITVDKSALRATLRWWKRELAVALSKSGEDALTIECQRASEEYWREQVSVTTSKVIDLRREHEDETGKIVVFPAGRGEVN